MINYVGSVCGVCKVSVLSAWYISGVCVCVCACDMLNVCCVCLLCFSYMEVVCGRHMLYRYLVFCDCVFYEIIYVVCVLCVFCGEAFV